MDDNKRLGLTTMVAQKLSKSVELSAVDETVGKLTRVLQSLGSNHVLKFNHKNNKISLVSKR